MARAIASPAFRRTIGLLVMLALLVPATMAFAEDEDGDGASEPVEEFVVTGSHIRRSTFEGPSPVEVLDREDFEVQAPQLMTDLTRRLTANSGAEFQEDQFTANATSGTASVNLRGLGLSSTLVLLNGKRAVASPGPPNSGATFVDINNFPVDMIERVEIVKDGTAALYGSDAVAGVVNFITRKNFTGLELNGSWQSTTEDMFTRHAQEDSRLSLVFGAAGDRTRITGNVSWLDRTPLDADQRSFTQRYAPENLLLGVSTLGNPPTFIPQAGPLAGLPVHSDACGVLPNSFPGPSFGLFPSNDGFCNFQFADAFQIVGRETRIDGYSTFEHDLTDTIQAYAEAGFNYHRNKRTTSPSFPALQFPTVPATHPGNPTAFAPFNGLGGPWDITFLGRAFGSVNDANDGKELSKNQLDTWRVVAGLKGDFAGVAESGAGAFGAKTPNLGVFDDWTWDLSYLWSQSRLQLRTNDILRQNFFDSLVGLGGTNCDRVNGTPGTAPCFYFNPFPSTQAAVPNNPDVVNDILAKLDIERQTTLHTVDGVMSGTVAELPGGDVGVAVGAQYRHEKSETVTDDNSQEDRFLFTFGTPSDEAQRDVGAVFGELSIPVWSGVETQAAVRYERYSSSGDSTDPKIGLRLRPFDWFEMESPVDVTLRGNYSTAFRAPSLFQQSATQTTLQQLTDNFLGSTTFQAVRTFGSKDLDNEKSTTLSGGATLGFLGNDLSFSADWWYFDYQDIIVKPSAQAILNAEAAAGGNGVCPPGIPGCRAVVRPGGPGTPLSRIETEFFNAASTITQGIDLLASYHIDPADYWTIPVDAGAFDVVGKATYIGEYKIKNASGDPSMDVAGLRNFTTFASSLPRWRFNGSLIWSWRNQTLANNIQYISDYRDDECLSCVGRSTRPIDAWVSWDITYSMALDGFGEGTVFSLALLNVTDEDPPPVATNGGYDTRIHDPRGRMFQIGFTQRF